MYDLIIIGAGPSGLVAGLYAGRFRLKALILEKMTVGGQILLSPTIENFPGFPGGIQTAELIEKFKKQIDELGVPVISEETLEIIPGSRSGVPFFTVRSEVNSYEARSLIIASGASPKKLGVPGEDKFIGRGVSYCATCDAPFFRNKSVFLVGGGDRALEEALYLTQYACKVTMVHRRKLFRGSEILEEKARNHPQINFMLESVIEEVMGKAGVESVKIKNVVNGSLNEYPCQGIFIFVGIQPNTGFVRNLLQLNETGFIITTLDMKTSVDGVFACGDCCNKSLYQVVNACGEGAVAADSAHKYLLLTRK